MIYLNELHLQNLGIEWENIIRGIKDSCQLIELKDFSQPIKPYLRYRNPTNRIIAMPAFIGGDFNASGIKWIASFPGNLERNIPRAHSVTILNNADTGVPECILNTPLISGIRTAAVSGYVASEYVAHQPKEKKFTVGVTGFGPIGKLHASMINDVLGTQISTIKVFDLKPIDLTQVDTTYSDKITVVDSWQEAFEGADIFMTCTVSKIPYIDLVPKKGSLQLNVSLRDYKDEFLDFVDHTIVDDWDEVCREATDIERMHLNKGLKKEDTLAIHEIDGLFAKIGKNEVSMFNPMGMAIFDIAVGKYYLELATKNGVGVQLDS